MSELSILSSATKQDLLLMMKQQGAISLDEAEARTGLTRTTLREHLGKLERDGLVKRWTKRHGRGRPSLRYNLTTNGSRLFPSRDGDLLARMLDYLQQEGQHALIESFFHKFWDDRLRDVRYRLARLDPTDEDGRIDVLMHVLREEGFMPEISRNENGLVIRECNCPFPLAVKRTRLPCRLEAEFFEQIFGRPMGRVSYIPEGSPACTYEIPTSGESSSESVL